MKIVLIGFMCSGKSVVGRLLAHQLGWPHFDTDEMISKQTGMSIADLIRKQGEPAFREVERKAVQLVVLSDPSVISTGGGVPLNVDNMNDLKKNSRVVWLKVSPEKVLSRAGNFKSRPLINPNDPLGSIREKMAVRENAYAQAHETVDTDQLTIDEIVAKILPLVSQLKS
jgi:shikimate kinase